jgi:LPS-assembly protein
LTPGRTRSLTFALLCVLGPGIARSQLPDDVRLKVERQLHLAPAKPERDSAKFLEADHIAGDQQNMTATGDVVLRQRGATIRADRLDYAAETQKAVGTGNVQLERYGDKATGPRLDYDLAQESGEMQSPVFQFPKTPERRAASRGQASRAVLETDNRSRLFDAEYTSCPAPRDDWFIRVHELQIDGGRNVGTAYNTTVYFLGMPILYSPYLAFPLDNKRRSGFLAPTFGTSGKSGFEAALPYYWNIAENMDATITPKIYTKRGVQVGGEFRYLEKKYAGIVEAEFLPNDRIAERDRYFLGWRHDQALWGNWRVGVNAQKVSDDNYFRDLSTKIAVTSQTNLPRDLVLAFDNEVWSFAARVLGYQTLQDPSSATPIPKPYQILPRLSLSGLKQNFAGLDWQLFSEYANFTHPTLVNGQRAIVYPSVSLPWRRSWGYVVPKVGYHYTRYAISENPGTYADASRGVPIASVDAGMFFDRNVHWGSESFQQTLEPRLYYLHVPYRDQSNLPIFTTAESDFNFAQIFTENRFVGGDRIGDANQITIALTSRLIESSTGLERLRAGLGQVYYFSPPKVTLASEPPSDKTSDIVAFAAAQATKSISVETNLQYTPSFSRSQKLTLAAHYLPVPGSVINAAYRYVRGSVDLNNNPVNTGIHQVDVSSQWPITQNINALARWNWSVSDHKVLEALAGFEYNAGCWQLRAVAHRFITATQQYSTSFQIQLELTGLSRIGINPFETIRQNISGYRRSDEIAP